MSDNIESRLDKKMYALTHRPLFMFALLIGDLRRVEKAR